MVRGMVRKLDNLGRATIPIEYRRAIDLEIGDALDLYIENKVIRLMKGKGRKLDALGRYTLPIEVRRSLRLAQNDFVDIFVEGDEICIKREALQCVMCGSEDESQLREVNGVLICKKCSLDVYEKVMEEGI